MIIKEKIILFLSWNLITSLELEYLLNIYFWTFDVS